MKRLLLAIGFLLAAIAPMHAQTVPLGPRFVLPYQTVIDGTGVPLPGAWLYFYASGTNTPLNTYSDALLTTPNPNPVQANAAGVFPNIFLNGNYKVVLTDLSLTQIWSADPVDSAAGGGSFFGTNTTLGLGALKSLTTGTNNTVVGYQSGYETTTGSDNSFFGYQSGYANTTGSQNVEIGSLAGANGTTGLGEVIIGYGAGENAVGSYNTIVGHQAGTGLASNGISNVCIGRFTCRGADTSYNTHVGHATGFYVTSGAYNTYIGDGTGNYVGNGTTDPPLYSNITGSYQTFLGEGAGPFGTAFNDTTGIGAFAIAACSNCVILGGTGSYAVKVGIGTTAPISTLDIVSTAIANQRLAGAAPTSTTGAELIFQAGNSSSDNIIGTDALVRATGTSNDFTLSAAASAAVQLYVNAGTHAAQFDSSGNTILYGRLGLGSLGVSSDTLFIGETITGDSSGAIKIGTTYNGTQTYVAGIFNEPTFGASFAGTTFIGYDMHDAFGTSGYSLTNQVGIKIQRPTKGTTNNIPLWINANTVGNSSNAVIAPPSNASIFVTGIDGGSGGAITLAGYNGQFSNPTFSGVMNGGTAAGVTAMSANRALFQVTAAGSDGTTRYNTGGLINFITAANNWTASDHSTLIQFQTVPLTTTTPVTAMTLQASGGISVGTAADPGINAIAAANYFVGSTAGVSCTVTTPAHLTVVKGIVTVCN